MSYMKDKVFIDTNIFVYAFLDSEKNADHAKHLKAVDFLKVFHSDTEVIISAQVLSAIDVVSLSKKTVIDSFVIRNRFHYSYWDSLIIASALEHDCIVLYSEDMQHDQIIQEQLRIINPFK